MDSFSAGIEKYVQPLADWFTAIVFFAIPVGDNEIPLILIWLFAGSIFFTVYLGWQQLRPGAHSISYNAVRGKFARSTDPGEVTSFQALATELSGTVGLGNIAGVAIAISIGGPGAAFWIVIAGLFGMAVKMAEATIGSKFRIVRKDGTTDGGPMYYLRDGLAQLGKEKLGRVLAACFAFATILGMTGSGALFQTNQAVSQVLATTNGRLDNYDWIIGIIFAVLVAVVIIGGISKIGNYTARIVPLMAILYVSVSLLVIFVHINQLPDAVRIIVEGAFTGKGAAGGVLGAAIVGIRRAAFSNAAGTGTAGFAHSTVKTRRPASQGLVAMWEPFVDSVVVCFITAVTVVITGVWQNPAEDAEGVQLTSQAWQSLGSGMSYLLTIAVVLFAFSTMLSQSYYAKKAVGYLFRGSRLAERIYNIVFVVLIVIGAVAPLDAIVAFGDGMLFLMAIPNLLGLYFLAPMIKREIFGYRQRVKEGHIAPVDENEQLGMLYKPNGDLDPAVVVGNIPEGGGSMGEVPTGSEPGEFNDEFYCDDMPDEGSGGEPMRE